MTKTTELKPIDKPSYRYWDALYRSFYSKNLYVDVGKKWKGLGLLYLLLVIALLSIPLAIKLSMDIKTAFNDMLYDPLVKTPILYIQNGQLSFDKPMPYLVKNNKGKVVLIIDTTGSVNTFTTKYPDLSILINKDKLSYLIPIPKLPTIAGLGSSATQQKSVPFVQSFGKAANEVFDGKRLVESHSISWLQIVIQWMTYPMVVAAFFSIFIIMFLVLAMMGQVLASVFFSFSLSYFTACRLLCVSSTPMLVFLIGTMTFHIIFNGMGIVLLGLLFVYYSLALFYMKQESRKVALR